MPTLALQQDLRGPPYGRGVEFGLLAVERGLKPRKPFVHDRCRYLVIHVGGWRSGAGAIFEAVALGVAHLFDDAQRIFKFGIRFAGEADDEVAGNGDVGARMPHPFDDAQIAVGAVAAVHRF